MEETVAVAVFVGMTALVVLPPAVLRLVHGARWRWFALGIASWSVALLVKAAGEGATSPLTAGLDPAVGAARAGALSALAELGFAALLLHRSMRTADVLAFGVGIGCFELVFKVAMGLLAARGAPVAAAAEGAAAMSALSLVEHASTITGHTATRVLVYLARDRRRWLPALLAFTTFALVDGAATYGWTAGWDWSSPRVYGPFVAFLAVVSLVETTAARLFWTRAAAAA